MWQHWRHQRTPLAAALGFVLASLLAALAIQILLPPTPRRLSPELQLRQDLQVVTRALGSYRTRTGNYPVQLFSIAPELALQGLATSLKEEPLDPWGRPYEYRRLPGKAFELLSLGEDNLPGGEDAAADVGISSRLGEFIRCRAPGSGGQQLVAAETDAWRTLGLTAVLLLAPGGFLLCRRFFRRRPEIVSFPSARSGQEMRCVYCHDSDSGQLLPCPSCGTLLHSDCWRGLVICPTLGCLFPATQAATPAWAMMTRSREPA